MALFFTPDQEAVARESYTFWRVKTDHMHACALLGNEGGETGFIWKTIAGKLDTPAGDHGMARGIFQWWPARGDLVLKNTHYDVRNGTHLDMLFGVLRRDDRGVVAVPACLAGVRSDDDTLECRRGARVALRTSQATDDVRRSRCTAMT